MHQYALQCDVLRSTIHEDRSRSDDPHGEAIWQAMMDNAHHITEVEFLEKVDISQLIDLDEYDDEEGIELIALNEFCADDPEAYFAVSEVDGQELYFIGTAGFEFIFTEKGQDPREMGLFTSNKYSRNKNRNTDLSP